MIHTLITLLVGVILLIIMWKFLELSIKTGVTSGFNKGLDLQPTEEDIQQERLYFYVRIAYMVVSAIFIILLGLFWL